MESPTNCTAASSLYRFEALTVHAELRRKAFFRGSLRRAPDRFDAIRKKRSPEAGGAIRRLNLSRPLAKMADIDRKDRASGTDRPGSM
jgi:hypothetical protein